MKKFTKEIKTNKKTFKGFKTSDKFIKYLNKSCQTKAKRYLFDLVRKLIIADTLKFIHSLYSLICLIK